MQHRARHLYPLAALLLIGWSPQEAEPDRAQPAVQQSHFFQEPMLVGIVDASHLREAPFAEWFVPGYDEYSVRPLAELGEDLADPAISIEVFFGTWCDDSTRELPRLLRLLDEAAFAPDRLTLHALSDNPGVFKMTPYGREHELRIHRTPTIVVLRRGEELGRIVERPATTLEADLAAILAGSPAPTPYGAEAELHARYLAGDVQLVQAPTSAFLDQLEAFGDTDSLWHYARYDLLFNGRPTDAADVLHIFLTLHPDSILGYRLLAQAESDLGNPGAALFAVRRALALAPDSGPARALEKEILAAATLAATQVDQERAATYFAQARDLCEREDGQLWGVSLCGPMVFADAATHTLATNQPAPAEDWPRALGFANSALRWGGERWSTYVWQMIPADDPVGRARLIMHELFHRVQFDLGLMTANGQNDHLDTLEGRYWLQLEWRALARALRSTAAERSVAIRDALSFRSMRHELFPDAAENERVEEIREGLAQYTGTVVATPTAAAAAISAIEQLEAAPSQPSLVRTAAYTSGVAYGLLLDAWAPGWTRQVQGTDDLAQLLIDASGIRPGSGNEIEIAAASYGAGELRAAEERREVEHLARVAELRGRFVEGPVLIVPRGRSASFVTTGATAIPDAGTTLSAYRVAGEWGSLEATMVLVSADSVTLRVPAPAKADGTPVTGDGWTLELASGWVVQPGPRAGDFQVVREDR